MNDISKIFERQKRYALRVYQCLQLNDVLGNQINDTMFFKVEKPFVLLHAFVADQTVDTDRENNMNQGISNSLLFLENHPIVQVASIADISAFHVSENVYYVDDNRNHKLKDKQFVYVLQCLDF